MVALTELGAAEAAAAIRAGDVSAQALVEALLDRCARAAPLNAFISLDPDAVRAAADVLTRAANGPSFCCAAFLRPLTPACRLSLSR